MSVRIALMAELLDYIPLELTRKLTHTAGL